MNYELRKLTSEDIFPMAKIISLIGFKEFKNALDPKLVSSFIDKSGEKTRDKLAAAIGINVTFEVAGVVMANLNKCKKEIYEFLSSVSGLEDQNLKEMSPAEFLQLVIDVIEKEEFKDFFKVVSKYLN